MIDFDHKVKVYYRDVDQMGIVYYARYLEYFEEARTELLRNIGISVPDIEQKGYFLPVISVNCQYKNPAKFGDNLVIKTKIIDIPRSTLKIEYLVRNSDTKICVTGDTTHTFINRNGKAVKPPKDVVETIKRNMKWRNL